MGVEIKQTETFRKWRTRLKDNQPCLDRFPPGPPRLWSCGGCRAGRTGGQRIAHPLWPSDTAFTSRREGRRSSSCCAVATKARKRRISRWRSAWEMNGANEMAEAFKTNDTAYIAQALGVVARAKGMAQIAGQTGLSRKQLYRSFSENGNPTLKTTLAVMKALGIELTAKVSTVP